MNSAIFVNLKGHLHWNNGLDKIDLMILRELLRDGRLSHVDIGEIIGKSHCAVANRMKALEKSGYITGYRAILNREKLGFGYNALLFVQLEHHGRGTLEAFERALQERFPNVLECLTSPRFFVVI